MIQDYEYSSYNPVAYDLANHFCEMAANYHSDTPHVLDYSKYPGKGISDAFYSLYYIYILEFVTNKPC
jgi:choline/ethanolamine kinase